MNTDREADDLVSALLLASRVLVAVTARSVASVEDAVTLTQFRALVVIDSHEHTNINRLSEELGVNTSTATRGVDQLVSKGLVDRIQNPHNRREVIVTLTAHGKQLTDAVTERRSDEIRTIVQQMPADRASVMVSALKAFGEAASEPIPDRLAEA